MSGNRLVGMFPTAPLAHDECMLIVTQLQKKGCTAIKAARNAGGAMLHHLPSKLMLQCWPPWEIATVEIPAGQKRDSVSVQPKALVRQRAMEHCECKTRQTFMNLAVPQACSPCECASKTVVYRPSTVKCMFSGNLTTAFECALRYG